MTPRIYSQAELRRSQSRTTSVIGVITSHQVLPGLIISPNTERIPIHIYSVETVSPYSGEPLELLNTIRGPENIYIGEQVIANP